MDNIKLNAIQRPRLLMATAKEYVNRRRLMGKPLKRLPEKELERLILEEEKLEHTRAAKSEQYKVDRHIAVLAELITQAHLRTPLAS